MDAVFSCFHRIATRKFITACLVATAMAVVPLGSAAANDASLGDRAKQIWQLLDYIAVDYGGAVQKGKVQDPAEYAEMREFAATVEQQIAALRSSPESKSLQQDATTLSTLIATNSEPEKVAAAARQLAARVLEIFPFQVTPNAPPDLTKGATLFKTNCASCHGESGRGDGPAASSLDPRPTDFSERARARERSLFALYQVISRGVSGTGMQGFETQLSESNRWDLAFFVGTLSYTEADREKGASLWDRNPKIKEAMGNITAVTQLTEHALAASLSTEEAATATAHFRSHPETIWPARSGMGMAKSLLTESLTAYEAGNRPEAAKLALAAYLDGFEPLEPVLRSRDNELLERIEAAMAAYRASIGSGTSSDVRIAERSLQALLDEAQIALSPSKGDAFATYLGALTILLREGLEALLVLVAMIAFLHKAERPDALRYVHFGWILALVAGVLTWLVATHIVGISGANRELTEGFSSLFAAAVLLAVGLWMHQKSIAGRWQTYLKEKMSAALNKRAAWFLFALAFIAVYREVFETVLFYIALWSDGNGLPLLAGLLTGIAILGIVAFVLLRSSARLPIGKFFAVSSLLVALLAVILVGKGVSGLQEAGLLSVSTIAVPRIDVLGIYPSVQTLLAQIVVLVIALVGFVVNLRLTPTRASSSASSG